MPSSKKPASNKQIGEAKHIPIFKSIAAKILNPEIKVRYMSCTLKNAKIV